ncbi:hypothetical protein J3E68DRAFT_419197 [Trichoderma sp. SZMC 28012]
MPRSSSAPSPHHLVGNSLVPSSPRYTHVTRILVRHTYSINRLDGLFVLASASNSHPTNLNRQIPRHAEPGRFWPRDLKKKSSVCIHANMDPVSLAGLALGVASLGMQVYTGCIQGMCLA